MASREVAKRCSQHMLAASDYQMPFMNSRCPQEPLCICRTVNLKADKSEGENGFHKGNRFYDDFVGAATIVTTSMPFVTEQGSRSKIVTDIPGDSGPVPLIQWTGWGNHNPANTCLLCVGFHGTAPEVIVLGFAGIPIVHPVLPIVCDLAECYQADGFGEIGS